MRTDDLFVARDAGYGHEALWQENPYMPEHPTYLMVREDCPELWDRLLEVIGVRDEEYAR